MTFAPRTVAASAPAAPGDPAAAVALAATPTGQGLWVADADGSVAAGGDATAPSAPPGLPGPAVGMAPTATGKGWWLATAGGAVVAQGDAAPLGPAQPLGLDGPLVGMAATPSHRGFWLVASDGGVFAYGDARFFGSAGGTRLNQPIVGMAATPDGNGYWLVASDGGVFAYGDARFFGSAGGSRLNEPIVGMAATPDGSGYWLVATDGGVFTYGDARFFGSVGGNRLAGPIVGIAGSRDGGGYWVLGVDGTVSAWGDAPAMPRLGPAPHPVFNVASTFLAVHDDGRPTPARGGAPAHPGRDLPTVVLYPAALDGVPLPGPWPVVAFAHGFNTTPDDYLALLRSWAAAGYVVAAPFLPGERGDLPGPDRADIPEEPADLSAVLSAVLSQAAPSPLAGLADAARVAVAGHSDGGMAVAGMTLGSLPHDPRVRAALVLSGDTFGTAGGNVPVLLVEGTADPINPAAADRVWSVAGAPKAAVRILGGGHLAPFVTAGPQQDAVRAATVDFLDAELSGARDGLSRLAHDADVPGLTSLSAALR
ncbi:MAG TPA: hypothetical protein VFA84_07075 [Acidimicrobiales bacterium]|nr:hypothetical protein [Acidimicrobiales bacterium]